MKQGLDINTMICIDFSMSNGDPAQEGSLHSRNPTIANNYQQVMQTVMPTLFYYDFDRMIPMFGFGAKFPSLRVDEQKDFFKVIGRN